MQQLLESYTENLTRHPNQNFQNFVESLSPDDVKQWLDQVYDQLVDAKSLEEFRQGLTLWNEIKSHLSTHFELVELAYQCSTKDETLEQEERRLKEDIEPIVEKKNAKIRPVVLTAPYRKELEKQMGSQYFTLLQLAQENFEPRNVELEKSLNGIMADYTKLTGDAHLEYEGQRYPISHYKKFANDENETVRKSSFLSFSSWYLNHREGLEAIFDQAMDLRQEMGRNLGYENFIPLGYRKMRRVDYGPEEVAALREEIHQVLVPLSQKIRQRQAKSLQVDKVQVWNGDYFPEWQLGEMKIKISEQPEAALRIYEKVSPELAQHFRKMLKAKLIDLEAREAKGPGAFCTSFSDFRVPFVFLNSVGEASDLTTMLHECGHSFQAWESGTIDWVELRWPSLEACEVHSMSMEFLAYPYYEEFLTAEDSEKYRQKHLAESLFLLPYIAMVDEFQHLIYSEKAQGSEGRAQAWESLEAKYNPEIDFSDCPEWKRHRWVRQLHIFRAPFYYIDYAIAQIGAWQLWMRSLKDREQAMEDYLKLCKLGGTLPLKEFFQAGNLKLPFEKGFLGKLVEEILAEVPLI